MTATRLHRTMAYRAVTAYLRHPEDGPRFGLHDRMRLSMREAGINSNGMAERLGMSKDTVSKWLRGINRPRPYTRRQWAQITGVSLEWLEQGYERQWVLNLVKQVEEANR